MIRLKRTGLRSESAPGGARRGGKPHLGLVTPAPDAPFADPSIPIAGMPILDVDQAQSVVVIKRSLSHGFAGIPNPLFAADNTMMLFGDGKEAVVEISKALVDL